MAVDTDQLRPSEDIFGSTQLSESNGSLQGIGIAILLLSLYLLYYLGRVVNKPKLVGGGNALRDHLLDCCPSLRERYWPTIWAFHCHMTTILRAMYQKSPRVQYAREVLPLADGGELALDWAAVPSDDDETIPVMLIMPGITGNSNDNYVMHLAQDGLLSGYRPVVFNQRGNGGLYLKTMRTYSAVDISDMLEVIHRIQCLYPEASIIGLGVSLGGMILTQYLHQMGKESQLSAAIAISVAWDPFKTRESLEQRLDNRVIYSKFMANNLCSIVRRNTERLTPEEIKKLPFCCDSVLKSATVSEFDHHLTVPLFGYSSVEEYYAAGRNSDKIHKISRPYICITAADDPFVPRDSLPENEFVANPNTMLVLTSHGGHFGFLEGLGLTIDVTWMDRICRQLLTALKHY